MRRREFAKMLALATVPWPAGAFAGAGDENWSALFAEALRESPWLAGWHGVNRNRLRAEATVSGCWPEELKGVLYRAGPARHEVFGYRNRHWFDGDGLVHAWRMGAAGVRHDARLVNTAKVVAERAAGRALFPGLVASPPRAEAVSGPDDLNRANTSVLYHHGRLLALWEAGSPYEIDPDTLATLGPYEFDGVGDGASMRGVPFSAHPRTDADGSVWNFGYASAAGAIVLWHVGQDGRLLRSARVEVDPVTMPHDFVVTERHLVLLLPPFHYRPEARADGFLAMHEWRPQDACRVLLVDKDDLSSHSFLELPAQWVFHFGNAWEDRDGVIQFDAARAPDPFEMTVSFSEIMRGRAVPRSPARHHAYRLDTRAMTVEEQPMLDPDVRSEFPCTDPRVSCRRYRRLVVLSGNMRAAPVHGMLDEVSTLDVESGRRESFRYPETQIPEEHLFVPVPGSEPETGGWILGTAMDWDRGRHVLNVFDAGRVSDGPIAAAELPYAIPIGLHGKFVPG